MIRPQRAFIMPRITARESRNTGFRLVSMTSSQSASFMRSARLSRVIPALFTSTAMSPNSFWSAPTSASHCALMQPAAQRLAERLAGLAVAAPTIPVVHNFDVESHADPAAIRRALVAQLHSPVRWVECVAALKARGATRIVECGPGKVLAGLVKRIDARVQGIAAADRATLEQALAAVKGG